MGLAIKKAEIISAKIGAWRSNLNAVISSPDNHVKILTDHIYLNGKDLRDLADLLDGESICIKRSGNKINMSVGTR